MAAVLHKTEGEAAVAHENDPQRGVRVDAIGRVAISKICLWYREDFGDSQTPILDHLRRHSAPELKSQLDATTTIHGYFYDRTLKIAAR
jgi:hypothetical protein